MKSIRKGFEKTKTFVQDHPIEIVSTALVVGFAVGFSSSFRVVEQTYGKVLKDTDTFLLREYPDVHAKVLEFVLQESGLK